jgi:2'-5' RNA ligase
MTGSIWLPREDPGTRTIGVAIPIPEPYGTQLQDWRAAFGDPQARAIPTHVTLLPPTDVPVGLLPEVDTHLRKVAEIQQSFPMHLRGSGTFRPVSPVVFVQIAEGIAGCEQLERHVRADVLDRELQFAYHPHVTVAHDLPDPALDRAFETMATYDARFEVTGFALYEHGDDGVWRVRMPLSFGS